MAKYVNRTFRYCTPKQHVGSLTGHSDIVYIYFTLQGIPIFTTNLMLAEYPALHGPAPP